jgi:phage FluMu protein Com
MLHPDIRCGHCGRKLASGRYIELTIKCPRCHGMNYLKAKSHCFERRRTPDYGAFNEYESHHSLAGRQATSG